MTTAPTRILRRLPVRPVTIISMTAVRACARTVCLSSPSTWPTPIWTTIRPTATSSVSPIPSVLLPTRICWPTRQRKARESTTRPITRRSWLRPSRAPLSVFCPRTPRSLHPRCRWIHSLAPRAVTKFSTLCLSLVRQSIGRVTSKS